MGAGYTKILTYLDVGPEDKEDKLKKKYLDILTTGNAPAKTALNWRSLPLDVKDTETTTNNLKEGAQFIHSARVRKENILVCISQSDPDSLVFATAYIMILSGLSPDTSEQVISNLLKETDLKLEGKYKKALETLSKQYQPKILREQLFKPTGEYPLSLLTEDVNKIYELAGLPKPTLSQVKLEDSAHPKTIAGSTTDAGQTKVVTIHSDQAQDKTVPVSTRNMPEKLGSNSGQDAKTPAAHAPMTLAETENRIPVGPAIQSGPTERKNYSDLAEMHSAHIEASLLAHGLPKPLKDCHQDCTLVFAEHSAIQQEGYAPSITEWNSVQEAKGALTQPSIRANTKSQRHVVFDEPVEEIKPKLDGHVSATKPTATLEASKPQVSDSTLVAMAQRNGIAGNQSVPTTRNSEIEINGATKDLTEIVKRKTNIKIVRLKPADIEHNIKQVNEYVNKNSTKNQVRRKPIKIIRLPPKVDTK